MTQTQSWIHVFSCGHLALLTSSSHTAKVSNTKVAEDREDQRDGGEDREEQRDCGEDREEQRDGVSQWWWETETKRLTREQRWNESIESFQFWVESEVRWEFMFSFSQKTTSCFQLLCIRFGFIFGSHFRKSISTFCKNIAPNAFSVKKGKWKWTPKNDNERA